MSIRKQVTNKREKVAKIHFYGEKEQKVEDKSTYAPKNDGRKHIKWADDIKEVKKFRKFPTQKTVEKLIDNIKASSKVCGQGILKKTNYKIYRYDNCNSDTEASSNGSDAEVIHQNRRVPSRKPVHRSSTSAPRQVKKAFRPMHKPSRSSYLEDMLMSRLRNKYQTGYQVSIY
jgi:hypothetical protein